MGLCTVSSLATLVRAVRSQIRHKSQHRKALSVFATAIPQPLGSRISINKPHIMQHPFINSEQNDIPITVGGKLNINEYLLIIQPHEDLYNKIMGIKKQFAEKYDCPTAMYSKPHITLVNFVQWEMQEKKFVSRLKNIFESATPFRVSINGFGSFPTHTIYANVQTKNDIVDLVKSTKSAQSLLSFNVKNKAHFITEPHITIARKLLPWQYEKGWLEYSNTSFSASFMVNEAVLLKKHIDAKKYNIATSFFLLNKPSETATQASFFS